MEKGTRLFIERITKEKEDLQTRLATKDQENLAVRELYEEAQKEREKIKAESPKQSRIIWNLEEQVKEKDALCDTHVETIVSFKDENQELKRVVEIKGKEIDVLAFVIKEKEREVAELSSHLHTRTGEREYLKEKIIKLEKTIKSLSKVNVEMLQKKLKQFDSLLVELTAKSKRDYLQNSIQDLYARIAQEIERILNEGKEKVETCMNCKRGIYMPAPIADWRCAVNQLPSDDCEFEPIETE